MSIPYTPEEFLKATYPLHAVSGNESAMGKFLKEAIARYADEVSVDPLGNVIALRHSGKIKPRRFAFYAPMDSTGFILTYLDKENDRAVLRSIGEFDRASCVGNDYLTESGLRVTLSSDADKSAMPVDGLWFTGANALSDFLREGDTLSPARPPLIGADGYMALHLYGERILAWVLLEIARRLSSGPLSCDIAYVFTTQRHISNRGVSTASFAVSPSLSVFLDLLPAKGDTKPGSGAVLCARDEHFASDSRLLELAHDTAVESEIPHTFAVYGKGEHKAHPDAAFEKTASFGAASLLLGVPCKNIGYEQLLSSADLASTAELCTLLARF